MPSGEMTQTVSETPHNNNKNENGNDTLKMAEGESYNYLGILESIKVFGIQ